MAICLWNLFAVIIHVCLYSCICYNYASDTGVVNNALVLSTMVAGSNLSWQGIKKKAVYTKGAGLVCKCIGQCTLEGSVQDGG